MQLALTFPRALVRRTDPLSSHRAADKADKGIKHQNELCLEAVRKNPGSTSAEIAEYLGVDRHMPARRLPGLRDSGLVLNWYRDSEWANVGGATEKFSRKCRVTGNRSMTWWPR